MNDHDSHKRTSLPQRDEEGDVDNLQPGSEEAQEQAPPDIEDEPGWRSVDPDGNSNLTGYELIPEEQVAKVLKSVDLPPEVQEMIKTRLEVAHRYSGPLPLPDQLREYEKILPGAADRIMSMAEKSLDANIYTNRRLVNAEARGTKSVSISFSLFPLVFAIVAWFALKTGQEFAGIIAAAMGFAAVFPTVINALKNRKKSDASEHDDKE